MTYDWLAAVSSVKIVIAFLFFFIYLPMKLFPQRQGASPVERFFENLVLIASSSIILVHLLSLARIYSVFTLLAASLAPRGGLGTARGVSASGLKRFAWKRPHRPGFLDGVVDLKAVA